MPSTWVDINVSPRGNFAARSVHVNILHQRSRLVLCFSSVLDKANPFCKGCSALDSSTKLVVLGYPKSQSMEVLHYHHAPDVRILPRMFHKAMLKEQD
jgi:bisphosphoglycerate-dependent phosphoglycerate mutase